MFDPTRHHRIFALPPGAAFATQFVDGMRARLAPDPPEAMARVTVYLNSGRMLRAVRDAFLGHSAGFLPKLKLISEIGSDPSLALPAAVSALRQQLELAQLIRSLVQHETDFAPGKGLFDLSASLSRLLAEMHDEGVSIAALEGLEIPEGHAAHWERSLRFLRLVAGYHDREDAAPDPELRQRKAVEALLERWGKTPPGDPVIIAGSTGSRGTTQLLMQGVARLSQGAIVLPGFDFDMTDTAWNSLCSGATPAEDHPQFRYAHLLKLMSCDASVVEQWTAQNPADPARNRLISLALRPAPVTDQWLSEGARLTDLGQATAHLSLIEAPTLRGEAEAIATRMRKAAEDGTRVALITPNRALTRRVSAALDRWRIIPDDSAGRPLELSASGRFLRETAALIGRQLSIGTLISVLKNPVTSTGGATRGDHLRFTRDLELSLRRHGPAFPAPQDLDFWASGYSDPDRAAWVEWLKMCLWPAVDTGDALFSALLDTHLNLGTRFAAGPGGTAEASELWKSEAGQLARNVIGELSAAAPHGGRMTPHDYSGLLANALAAGGPVRMVAATHPDVAIVGTLEARALEADLIILGGLNEGSWPELPEPDAWLSRQMRQKAGLLLPERQIGLSAHDFQQAVAGRSVILSRSLRDGEGEAVAARWLVRLTNLLEGLTDQGGPRALREMRGRGAEILMLAERSGAARDEHLRPPARRPSPRPPVLARPRRLSVTKIRSLVRDPYAVYAGEILRLRPLRPLHPDPDPALRGRVLHEVIEEFIRGFNPGMSEAEAGKFLLDTADSVLGREVAWPGSQRLWRARLTKISDSFIAEEFRRQSGGSPVILEKEGSITLDNLDFTLVARPDRIDLGADGRVHIYDYKSGTPPSAKQQDTIDKQLFLEAVMAERGAFDLPVPTEVAAVTYIHLGGSGSVKTRQLEAGQTDEVWSEFQRLIANYHRQETGYTARRAVFDARKDEDYDHLARFGEWQMTDPAVEEDVG
ncbi:MAG: double-strand break repair protein AddB [Rhodobacteraceae bacterium]|nr:double-strand break repair protein AddB [Paracoccaceae bacterium]